MVLENTIPRVFLLKKWLISLMVEVCYRWRPGFIIRTCGDHIE